MQRRGVGGRPGSHVFEELAVHPKAFAVRRFIAEPSTQLGDVVRTAARRPSTAEIARELVASFRWIARTEVREALVHNPFTPTRVALLLLPTCRDPGSLASANVHPLVQRLARISNDASRETRLSRSPLV